MHTHVYAYTVLSICGFAFMWGTGLQPVSVVNSLLPMVFIPSLSYSGVICGIRKPAEALKKTA